MTRFSVQIIYYTIFLGLIMSNFAGFYREYVNNG